jgi:hypothetical protein
MRQEQKIEPDLSNCGMHAAAHTSASARVAATDVADVSKVRLELLLVVFEDRHAPKPVPGRVARLLWWATGCSFSEHSRRNDARRCASQNQTPWVENLQQMGGMPLGVPCRHTSKMLHSRSELVKTPAAPSPAGNATCKVGAQVHNPKQL